jgi:hypothetical protein
LVNLAVPFKRDVYDDVLKPFPISSSRRYASTQTQEKGRQTFSSPFSYLMNNG